MARGWIFGVRLPAREATILILLPLASAAIGITLMGVALGIAASGGEEASSKTAAYGGCRSRRGRQLTPCQVRRVFPLSDAAFNGIAPEPTCGAPKIDTSSKRKLPAGG